jgi:DNA replication regulator SLD3
LPNPSRREYAQEALLNFLQSVDNDKPLTFRILRTLPRATLPLSYIGNSDTPTRIFSANLPQLDHDEKSSPLVLFARLEAIPDQSLYTVERVGHKRYALCRLAAWLEDSHIEALDSTPPSAAAPLRPPPLDTSNLSWWQPAEIPLSTRNTSRKAPRLSLCLRLPPQAGSALQLEPELDSQPLNQPAIPDETCETSEDFLDRFLSQYLDTLYLSKTPLAFFTKGPLSRLRAAFTTGQVQGASLPDLVQFLRSLVHSSSTADKKYRDKLPELLKELPSQHPDRDNTPATKKKRRKKKLKPDKYGLLPEEADFFAKWWYQDESSAPTDETAEQSLKRKGQQLRTRETFMQLVLILEILSLEALPEFKMQEEAQPSKGKKSDSITTSLELLVDRLCIWHSLHSADLLGDAIKPDKTTKDGANQLHSFCVDVVIPFYMSRTHEHASLVNKKLGGPGASTNTKPKLSRKLSEADIKTTTDKKARRPLARVATESFSQPAKAARSFSRSATDSQVVPVKSQTPELNMSSIPLRRDSQPSLARKSDVLEKHRLRQREVDFGAIAAANEAKAKKKQEVEQKLKDAISALKKPSRAAVSGEFVDAVEQRKRMAEGRARPPLHKRKSSSMAQVAATPKNGHKTSAIAATPRHIPAPSFSRPAVHSSGPSMVPSSNIKQKSLSFAHFSPVDEASDDDDASPTLLKTPSKPQRPKFSITPSRPTPPLDLGKAKAKSRSIATPLKITATPNSKNPFASAGQHRADENVSKDPPDDIYATLGWDDDLDDD